MTYVTAGDVLRQASRRTGLLLNHRDSHLASLTPNWKSQALPSLESDLPAGRNGQPSIVSPLLPPRNLQRKWFLYGDEDKKEMEALFESHRYESLFTQCTNKYTDLINKEGHTIQGTLNAPTVDFLCSRLLWISAATRKPFETTIKELTRDFVQYGRGFLVKKRLDPEQNVRIGGKLLKTALSFHGDVKLGVIGGYFRADPLTFHPRYDKDTDKLIGWEQRMPGKEPRLFNLEEVIHFPHNPKNEDDLGVSMYSPVIDDVRQLRQMEEFVYNLVYKHLFPYLHHEIPDNVGDGRGTEEDIREAVFNHVNIAPDGMIITPKGHKITAVETVNATLNAEPYLKHCLQRVLMGLGLSEAIMGLGDAAVGMSDMLTAQMHDRVKSLQQDIERIITLKILFELLVEAGFDPINKKLDYTYWEFNEIELETVVRMENHYANMYGLGVIDQDEARGKTKLNPLTDKQRKLLQINQEKIPVIQAQVEAETAGQIKVLRETHELQKDMATHTTNLGTQAANDQVTHATKLGKDAAAHSASLQATGKPPPAAPPAPGTLKAPKLASKASHLNLNPLKKPSGGSTAGTVGNKDNPKNQHGARGAPRFSKSPAAGPASKKTPDSAK